MTILHNGRAKARSRAWSEGLVTMLMFLALLICGVCCIYIIDRFTLKQRKELIVNFYKVHRDEGVAYTVKHFLKQGVARSTTYKILKSFQERNTTERKTGSGRRAEKLPAQKKKRLVKAAMNKNGVSQAKLAQKFGVHKSYVQKVLKKEGCKNYKKQKVPEWTEEKELRKLTRTSIKPSSSVEVVIDDESYFPFGHSEMPGNDRFYTKDKSEVPPSVRYLQKKKFEPKLLVWLAISEEGHSKPFFVPSRGNVNGNVYRNKCIMRRLVSFLQQYHEDGDYVFWPDLASSHYAKDTVALLRDQNINFVRKQDNPPNVPQLWPFEKFWGILKSKVYNGGWTAKTEHQLKLRIQKCLRELDWEVVQGMMSTVKTNLRKAADTSPRKLL